MITRKLFILFAVSLAAFVLFGCGAVRSAVENVSGLVGLKQTGTIIVNRAQIRSAYAVVASDLLEVKRGETVDILEEFDFEKVHWYRVRARDEDNTEGWIEAQNLITNEVLEKSKKLAKEDTDLQLQALGQLRAASNLRLSPEQKDDNILFKLENGASFEITDWKFVQKALNASETDYGSKTGQNQVRRKTKNAEIEAAKEADKPEDIDDKYDIWYKVRLDSSISAAPAGWLFGRQVELQVPSDIVFYQNNAKKFVAWHRLDNSSVSDKISAKDSAKPAIPGNWIVLTRSNIVKAKDGIEPQFDGIIVFGYDKYREEHYSSYRSGEVTGLLPLKSEGAGDNKTFSLQLLNTDGQMEEKRFVTLKDASGRLKVVEPPGIAKGKPDKPER